MVVVAMVITLPSFSDKWRRPTWPWHQRAPGLVCGFKGGAHCPDGDIVEIQPVAVPGVQRLNEEVPGGNVEDQRLGCGGFGFGCLGHDLLSDPGVIS